MSATLFACAVALLPAADPQPPAGKSPGDKPQTDRPRIGAMTSTPRNPHPLAPSLPELSEEEEKKIDAVIDRFIEADTGKLQGPDARKAVQEFYRLGPEATFALIRGMNKAAAIDHSCPAVTIARRLHSFLSKTGDTQLLQYARENIGLGVTKSRHMGVLKDLKMTCTARQNALERQGPTTLGPQ
jgi:hypothetical protein